MQPSNLQPEQFAQYPPEARKLVLSHLDTIRQLPLSFLPNLLREVIDYDFKFPSERSAIDNELATISSLSPEDLQKCFHGFAQISVSSELAEFDWINEPARFVELESAYLWTTLQQDTFRQVATDYGSRLAAAAPPEQPVAARLGIAIIGNGVTSYDGPLFRHLRAQGTYFSQVNPQNGLELLLAAVAARAHAHLVPYGHWYIDGGPLAPHSPLLACVSYRALDGVRAALLKNMQAELQQPGMGPEELRAHLGRLKPSDVAMDESVDPTLSRFQLKLLTEGSGTQIFSTTFAQWATREALRRAQPLTLLVHFTPRQRQRPLNELLLNSHAEPELDLVGSLVDADMGAYYHWINQQRLSGASQSVFLAWFEDHRQAIVVSPTLPRGVESSSAMDIGKILDLAQS
jgi:hypothetical protein